MKHTLRIGIGTFLLFPALSYAQTYSVTTLGSIAVAISGILETILPAVVSVSVFLIAWFTFKLVINAGDPEKRKQALHGIFWGVVGVFLMYSFWGVVRIFVGTIGFEDTTPITTPILLPSIGTTP